MWDKDNRTARDLAKNNGHYTIGIFFGCVTAAFTTWIIVSPIITSSIAIDPIAIIVMALVVATSALITVTVAYKAFKFDELSTKVNASQTLFVV